MEGAVEATFLLGHGKPPATHPAAMQSRAPNTICPARIVIIHIASYPYPTRALALIDCLLPSAGMEEIM